MLVLNGLQFEGWLDRLIDASDFHGVRVVATKGIKPIAFDGENDHGGSLEVRAEEAGHDDAHDDGAGAGHDHEREAHAEAATHDHDDEHDDEMHAEAATRDHDDEHDDETHAEAATRDHDDDHDDETHAEAGRDHHHHGTFDPHAWQSLGNAATYVDNITAALALADPENATAFYRNRAEYVAEIEGLDAEIREIVASLPADRRTVVTAHDAFHYFGRDYGLTLLAPQGVGTESEASAKDVARLIRQIRERGIRAIFIENIADARLLERIAEETGATVGGTLYPGGLSGPDGPAPTYLDMMRHNAMTLAKALAK